MNDLFTIPLGAKVEDKVTGFKGMTVGRVQYITGCNQYLVSPRVDEKGTHVEPHWFDEHRLTQTEPDCDPLVLDTAKDSGPDAPAPIK